MLNKDKLLYTYKHRKIVMFLAKKYFDNEKLNIQLKSHDMDKMYLLLFYENKDITEYHRNRSSHHDNELDKTELDYIEMVLDWESARYTKPDKPLNAYDTMLKYYPYLEDKVLPVMKKMGLDYSTSDVEEDVVEYTKTLENSTIDDVKKELMDYLEFAFSEDSKELVK